MNPLLLLAFGASSGLPGPLLPSLPEKRDVQLVTKYITKKNEKMKRKSNNSLTTSCLR
jgi:hypothetical protein